MLTSVEVWVLHSPYPNGTWRGDEKCCCTEEEGGGPSLFLSKQAALDFLEVKGLQDNHYVPVQCVLVTPSVGAPAKTDPAHRIEFKTQALELERDALLARLADVERDRNLAHAELKRLRWRYEVDEQDEADIGDIMSTEDCPAIVAWMRRHGFEFVSGLGVKHGALVIYEGSPMASETLINALANTVQRPPLDVLEEIKQFVKPVRQD